MATIREIVIDCKDADAMAKFWAEALGFTFLGAAGSYRALEDPSGGPKLLRRTKMGYLDIVEKLTNAHF